MISGSHIQIFWISTQHWFTLVLERSRGAYGTLASSPVKAPAEIFLVTLEEYGKKRPNSKGQRLFAWWGPYIWETGPYRYLGKDEKFPQTLGNKQPTCKGRDLQGRGLQGTSSLLYIFWNTRADLTDKSFIGSPKVKLSGRGPAVPIVPRVPDRGLYH